MAKHLVSNSGAPIIDLGVWVDASGNSEYIKLMNEHVAQMAANAIQYSAAFDAMVEVFLKATNQTFVD